MNVLFILITVCLTNLTGCQNLFWDNSSQIFAANSSIVNSTTLYPFTILIFYNQYDINEAQLSLTSYNKQLTNVTHIALSKTIESKILSNVTKFPHAINVSNINNNTSIMITNVHYCAVLSIEFLETRCGSLSYLHDTIQRTSDYDATDYVAWGMFAVSYSDDLSISQQIEFCNNVLETNYTVNAFANILNNIIISSGKDYNDTSNDMLRSFEAISVYLIQGPLKSSRILFPIIRVHSLDQHSHVCFGRHFVFLLYVYDSCICTWKTQES